MLKNHFNYLDKKGINLKEILDKRICVVGLGGLGTHIVNSLVRMGFKNFHLIDGDFVEESNLNRQILYDKDSIGKYKVDMAKKFIERIGKDTIVTTQYQFITKVGDFKNEGAGPYDIILDGTDNFEIRKIINRYAIATNTSWVMASALGQKGVIAPFVNGPRSITPCYECYTGEKQSASATSCNSVGILNTTLMMTTSHQVNLAIKMLAGQEINKELTMIDSWEFSVNKVSFNIFKNEECPVCGMFSNNKRVNDQKVSLICNDVAIDYRTPNTDRFEVKLCKNFTRTRSNDLFSEYEDIDRFKRIVFYHNRKITFYNMKKNKVKDMIRQSISV